MYFKGKHAIRQERDKELLSDRDVFGYLLKN